VRFAHDTEVALLSVASLVNTAHDGEALPDPAALHRWLDEQEVSGTRAGTTEELEAIRTLRSRLAAVWDTDASDTVVDIVNRLLAEADASPRLVRHNGWDWHLHLTPADAPLVDRLGTEAAMALADVVRSEALDRLKRCEAEGCSAVLVDLSRNRSRRFCDTGNCANRTHVAAYRARKASASEAGR
jgi:predicted RNA-binding Zn ribbon-like protein